MFPLDFEEFMWANNVSNQIIEQIKNSFDKAKTIDSIIHEQMVELFKQYIIVRGMSAVVDAYIKNF